ncbi:MAG: ABC-F family ATP-binding cassette domain-containing protein [Lachnospiraceae bacterium]|nr:ABC-F family ATP-binding cassette domain-containing protein [Lachnospiraceae bacterium]
MNLLSGTKLVKEFSEKKILDNTDFYLDENEKVGIIGINGTGKSTLLKILAGHEEADSGNVTKANHVVIKYLPQNPVFLENETVIEYILRENKASMDSNIEIKAKTMMTKLGLDDFDSNVSMLSGGQKKRTALVAVLVAASDILILDEPTNHLDNEMSDWLEEQLKNYKGSLIMVTHDRYFLDSVCNRIDEIDRGKIYSYKENYSGFLKLKSEREDMLIASDRKRKSILRNELAWILRGARARSTKQKARIERYETMKNTKDFEANGQVEMSSAITRLGKTTVKINNISKAYGDRILINDFSYIFLKNDRIGFIGKNGCGKTTLMKIISGNIIPDSGNIEVGQTVKIGYYSQEIAASREAGLAYMNPKLRVIDYIRETAEFVQTKDGMVSASNMLERFLFSGETQYSLIEKLSGGEKRRLNLLRVLMEAPNFLILDEPTNDLDISTLTILEDYLDSFSGIVVIVSHDRYFLDRTVNRIFEFGDSGNIRQFEGGYTDYSAKKMQEEAEREAVNITCNREDVQGDKRKEKPKEKKLKFSYQEAKDYETIEGEVEKLEQCLEEIDKKIILHARDFIRLNELTKEKEELKKTLDVKMDRWMYLEELKAKIDGGS